MAQGAISSAIKHLLARPVAFHPVLARMCGSVTAGLMLSQAIYWSDRTRDGSGWFYKSQREWSEEICLSRAEQESARKRLREMRFIQEELRGMPATVHFLVDMERLTEAFEQFAKNQQTSMRISSNPVSDISAKRKTRAAAGGKPANQSAEIQQTPLLAEITTETTHKSSSTATLDRVKATECLLRVGVNDQEMADRIIEAVLQACPDAEYSVFAHFVGEKSAVAGVRHPAGFLLSALPKCFEGLTYQRTVERLRKLEERRLREEAEREARENVCLCYRRNGGELVLCAVCREKQRQEAIA